MKFFKKLEVEKRKEEPLVTLSGFTPVKKDLLQDFQRLKEKLQSEYTKKNVVLVEEAGKPRWISIRYPRGDLVRAAFIRAQGNRITISARETECSKISKLTEKVLKIKFKVVERQA